MVSRRLFKGSNTSRSSEDDGNSQRSYHLRKHNFNGQQQGQKHEEIVFSWSLRVEGRAIIYHLYN